MTELTGRARGEMPGSGRLADRRIVVVGAGTQAVGAGTQPGSATGGPPGNGRAISVLAAREGAGVACWDIDESAARETAAMVETEGAKAPVLAGDATDPATAIALVRAGAQALGGLDGLVLNVGIGRGSKLAETTAADWDATFATNVRSHFLACQSAIPLMADGSSIVFIGSVAGLRPGTRIPAYDSSKAALAGLCRHVAMEGGRRGLRANVVAPGLIDTPLGRAASARRASRERTPVALGRHGTAWEVAEVVVWLLSDSASYVTGQVIAVDGGLSTL